MMIWWLESRGWIIIPMLVCHSNREPLIWKVLTVSYASMKCLLLKQYQKTEFRLTRKTFAASRPFLLAPAPD